MDAPPVIFHQGCRLASAAGGWRRKHILHFSRVRCRAAYGGCASTRRVAPLPRLSAVAPKNAYVDDVIVGHRPNRRRSVLGVLINE